MSRSKPKAFFNTKAAGIRQRESFFRRLNTNSKSVHFNVYDETRPVCVCASLSDDVRKNEWVKRKKYKMYTGVQLQKVY